MTQCKAVSIRSQVSQKEQLAYPEADPGTLGYPDPAEPLSGDGPELSNCLVPCGEYTRAANHVAKTVQQRQQGIVDLRIKLRHR